MWNDQYTVSTRVTPKQERFITEYLKLFNATEAARRAGFRGSENTLAVQGHRLLKHPLINERLKAYLAEHNEGVATLVTDRGGFTQERNHRVGYVYLVREPLGRVKIGKAVDVQQRLSVLNTGSPYELEIVAVIPSSNMRKLENELHRKFAAKRVRREWFELSDEDISEVIQQYGEAINSETEDVCAGICDLQERD